MTPYDPDKHHRRSIRLAGYDYTQAGAYFVTIVTHERALLFNDPLLRRVAEAIWQHIPRHFPHVALDEWVVMPNHIHGILWIVGARHSVKAISTTPDSCMGRHLERTQDILTNASPLPAGPPSGSLGVIVGNFKAVTARRINRLRQASGAPVWQRNYYERVIRDEQELNVVRQYIGDNPACWAEDMENSKPSVGARHSWRFAGDPYQRMDRLLAMRQATRTNASSQGVMTWPMPRPNTTCKGDARLVGNQPQERNEKMELVTWVSGVLAGIVGIIAGIAIIGYAQGKFPPRILARIKKPLWIGGRALGLLALLVGALTPLACQPTPAPTPSPTATLPTATLAPPAATPTATLTAMPTRTVPPAVPSGTWQTLTELRGHTGTVWSAAFSPDGRWVVTASWDNTARVWEVATGKVVAELRGHMHWVTGATFSPDGKQVVTASYDETARVWEASTGKLVAELRGHTGSVYSASFSPDGKLVVTASEDKTARVWEAATGKVVTPLRGHRDQVWSAAFSPDGKWVVTASEDGSSRVWEANTGHVVAELRGHTNGVLSASFSPDGKLVVTASWDGTARVWEATTGQVMVKLRGHTDLLWGASFSPDGQRVVSASEDKTARVWEASEERLMAELRGHTGSVYSASFSPDGKWVVTASMDKTARVWEAATGKLVAELRGHTDEVYNAAFSPDGKFVVTASRDGTARVWAISTE